MLSRCVFLIPGTIAVQPSYEAQIQAFAGSDPLMKKSAYLKLSAKPIKQAGCEPKHRHKVICTVTFLAGVVWGQHGPRAVSNLWFVVAALFCRVIVVSHDMSHTMPGQSLPHFIY